MGWALDSPHLACIRFGKLIFLSSSFFIDENGEQEYISHRVALMIK